MVYKFFDKKSTSLADKSASNSGIKNENIPNKGLAGKLRKSIIIKFEKRKVHSPCTEDIWGSDITDIQLTFYDIRLLLYVIDIYSKYTWFIPLKDKQIITITNAFQKILDEFNRTPNKIWVEKGSEFYNKSVKSWLEKKYIEMY